MLLRICHEEGVAVVRAASGHIAGGWAAATGRCVILGVARMNDVIETIYATGSSRCKPATNLT